MSFSNSVRNIKAISGYDQAFRFFNQTKKPKTARWAEDERPLYNTRSLHYKIVRGDNADYFDLVNYDTALIRYYKPDANGDQRILVRDWESAVSRQFLRHHGWYQGKVLRVLDGDAVRNGKLLLNRLTWKAQEHGVEREFSADITVIGSSSAEAPLIDLTRSRHIPGYKAASSAEDKAKRKQLKQTVDHWIELLGYRLDEYLNTEITTNKWQKQRSGEAFTSALELLTYKECDVVREAVNHAMDGFDLVCDEDFANAMTKLGHAVVTHLQGVRLNQTPRRWDHELRTVVWDVQQPITRADFRKSMESHLVSLLGLRVGSARVDIGQFPESIPRNWVL